MANDRFITLVIHTYDKAVELRKILESHGIEVRFENLVISGSPIASGVRVKIEEHNLPLALKIIESGSSYSAAQTEMRLAGERGDILIPVDFTSHSMLACKVGFKLAARLDLRPVILHAYATPYFMGNFSSVSAGFDDMAGENIEDQIATAKADRDLRREGERQMRELERKLETMQDAGELPRVKFSTLLNEGVPEEVILEYCRATPPRIVVMATRGKNRRDEDLVGSVTAEVLDSCRVPVFAIPENYGFAGGELPERVVYFCNLDQHDMLSVDTLMRIFEYPSVDVTLVPVNDRASRGVDRKVDALRTYFSQNYPVARFSTKVFDRKDFRNDIERFITDASIEMLIVPNKKKNIFSRIFNPGIAHRIIFERDIPILALPV